MCAEFNTSPFSPFYGPKDVEDLIGISQSAQRERRHRLKGYAHIGRKGENGRWQYTGRDMLILCIAEKLMDKHGFAFSAFTVGATVVSEVALHLGDESRALLVIRGGVTHPKAPAFPNYPDVGGEGLIDTRCFKYAILGKAPIFTDDPSHIDKVDKIDPLVIRLDLLAKAIPTALVERLFEDRAVVTD